MTDQHREVEDKYDVGESATLPRLVDLPGVATVEGPQAFDLEATYFDTPDRALTRAGMTLRRRTGGKDAGWHLKLPAQGARHEVQAPLGRSTATVPARLRDTLQGVTRGAPLSPLATLRTHRVVHRLLDMRRRELAEVADDHVRAEVQRLDGGPAGSSEWREWEVELVEGDDALLEAAGAALRAAGATPAAVASKLRRAVGDGAEPEAPPYPTDPDEPAAALVRARLAEQAAELRRRDPMVRADLPDSVHKMRVATRRLRSALATFRPLLDREVTDPVRDELKWLATVLGEARDAQVLSARMGRLIEAEGGDVVHGRVAARVRGDLGGRYQEALARCVEALRSTRYLSLLDRLDALVAAPPFAEQGRLPIGVVLPGRVRHEWRRLKRGVAEAERAEDPAERASLLHEARKAAKRARYAAESLVPAYGADAERFVKATKRIQTVLGDHHDSVVSRGELKALAERATAAGENAFAFGLLHAREEAAATRSEAEFADAWQSASKKKRRRWLS